MARWVYDGLGRAAWQESPVAAGSVKLRREEYFYDGVRRVQEVVSRPEDQLVVDEEKLGLLEPGYSAVSLDPLVPGHYLVTLFAQVWEQREYVYGLEYVDEFLVQFASGAGSGAGGGGGSGGGGSGVSPAAMWFIQDANYNVMGLVSDADGGDGPGGTPHGGAPGGGPPAPGEPTNFSGPRVLQQYTWEPYGTLVAAQNLAPDLSDPLTGLPGAHALSRVGHQGLFFSRFDQPPTVPALSPGAAGLYGNRNRWYDPWLGRFTTRDPNETALPVIRAMAASGAAIDTLVDAFSPSGHFGDGMG